MTRNLKRGLKFAAITFACGVVEAWIIPPAQPTNVAVFVTVFLCGASAAATSYILIDTLRRERGV